MADVELMEPSLLLACGIAFLLAGLLFAAAGFYLKLPSSVRKAPISAAAGSIFYVIGALTVVAGILAVAFHGGARKASVELGLLLYLAAVTVLLVAFTLMVKEPNDGGRPVPEERRPPAGPQA